MMRGIVVVVPLSIVVLLVAQAQRCNSSVVPAKNPQVCGKHNPDGIGFSSSVAENESKYGEFPWMVAVLKKQSFVNETLKVYQCGGSLIHPNVVLTAVHSIIDVTTAQLAIRAGEWDPINHNEIYPHQDRNVKEVVSHPDYHDKAKLNDIALLFLDSPVTLHDGIRTVCLPPPEASFDYQRCYVTGWGKNAFGQNGTFPDVLKKIEVAMVPANECQTAVRNTIQTNRFVLDSSFVCARGYEGKDACQGDGGSPLICPIQGSDRQYHQVGIVVWGIQCGELDVPGAYANVAMFHSWIDEEMQKKFFDKSSYTYTPQSVQTDASRKNLFFSENAVDRTV